MDDPCSGCEALAEPETEVERRAGDDDEETVRERLKLYHERTEPLKSYYEERGVLRVISGEGTQEEVFDRIVAAL